MRRIAFFLVFFLLGTAFAALAQDTDLYRRAEALVRGGQLDQGIAILHEFLATDPRNLKALNLLGIALTQKGDLAGANAEYVKALQIDTKFYPALSNLAINEFNLKDLASSEKHFKEAAVFKPDDPVVNAFLGKIAFKRGDYAVAAGRFEKSGRFLSEDPGLRVALIQSDFETGRTDAALAELVKLDNKTLPLRLQFQLGLILAEREHAAQAIPYFEAVRSRYPDSYDAGFNLAVCYVQSKQPAKAIDILTALKKSGHNTAELNNLLGEAYEAAGQLQPAIDALREATRLDPQDESNYLDLAALCTDHDALDLGLEIIEVGLHYKPDSDRLVFQRGILHALKNQFELADQDFQLANRLAPDKNLSYVGLGISYMQTGNIGEAVATLRQRVKEEPADARLQYLLGEALIRSGVNPSDEGYLEAKSALEKSVTIDAVFAPPRVDLAKLYLRENRIDEAVAQLEKARALDPSDKAAYSQLAVAYRRQGKPEKAAQILPILAKINEEERERESHGRIRLVKQSPESSAQ